MSSTRTGFRSKTWLWIGLTAGACVGTLALVEYLNFSGFCYQQRRYLTERELLTAGIQFFVNRQDSQTEDRDVVYSSPSDLLNKNPGCCRLEQETAATNTPILDKILGPMVRDVRVYYLANRSKRIDNYYDALVSVDSCGSIREIQGIAQKAGPTQ